MKRGVLFDLDETLIERKISLLEYARKLHCDYQDKAKVELESFLKWSGQIICDNPVKLLPLIQPSLIRNPWD